MKRMLAAICAALMLAVPALADTVVFENLHYGAEAYEMHLNNETNTIVFNGETYSLDDDAVSFKEAFSVYGGKTRAVYEMTLPQSAYSVEDDHQRAPSHAVVGGAGKPHQRRIRNRGAD